MTLTAKGGEMKPKIRFIVEGKSRDEKFVGISAITAKALAVMTARKQPALTGPLGLTVTATRRRPNDHYDDSGTLKKTAPAFPPGVLPLVLIEEALTGAVWQKKSQVVDRYLFERWSEDGVHRVSITIEEKG